jgi:hypothetical protein
MNMPKMFHRTVIDNDEHGSTGIVTLSNELLHIPKGKHFDVSLKVLDTDLNIQFASVFAHEFEAEISIGEMAASLGNAIMKCVLNRFQHTNNTESEISILKKYKVCMVVATISNLDDLSSDLLGSVTVSLN